MNQIRVSCEEKIDNRSNTIEIAKQRVIKRISFLKRRKYVVAKTGGLSRSLPEILEPASRKEIYTELSVV